MEFSCEKKVLQSGVSIVEKIVTTKSTIPIIGNILFEAGKNKIKLSANNLEMGIELELPAKVNKDGAVLIPAKTLAGLVAKLPETEIGFKLTEKGTIKLSYQRSNLSVHTLPPDEFPSLAKVKDGKSFKIGAATLKGMIKQTLFAVSASEDKYVLTGVLLETGKSTLVGDTTNIRLIATDGYRLAKRGEKSKGISDSQAGAIVPAKALQELLRIIDLEEEDQEVEITIGSEQASFRYAQAQLISRLIQGQFPDYKQVVPKKSTTKLTVNAAQLLAAAERAAVIASGSANIVRFEVRGNQLYLSASTPDVGTVEEVIEAEVKGENKTQVAFNIRLIADMLKVIEGERVTLELTEALGPGVMKQEDKADYLYIVMPIRTQDGG
jgi:DNA polymerase-3 subunit beta